MLNLDEIFINNPFHRKDKKPMSKTMQIVFGVIALLVVFFILIPLLPNVFYIKTIVEVIVVIVAIIWALSLGGINLP